MFRFYCIVLIVNLISLMCGMLLTWTSPILPKLISNDTLDQNPLGRSITYDEQSWIAALASLGGIFGPPLFGFVSEKFGRKISIAAIHIPNLISTLLAAFGTNIWYFYVCRFAAGMSISSAMTLGAVYFGEIAESRNRGVLYSTTSIFINLGTLLTYCIGPYASIRAFNLILATVAALGLILSLWIVPETPHYLIKRSQVDEAQRSLTILRPNTDIESEIESIGESLSKQSPDSGIISVFQSKAARKAFVASFVLTSLQQFSGVNVIYSFTELIFRNAGTKLTGDVSSILVGVAQFVSVYLTPLGVDRFGRKKMLIFASSGLVVTLALLGTVFLESIATLNTPVIYWLPIVCLILFFVFFNCGLGGLPFLVMSELFPSNVRSSGSSLVSAIYWFTGFIVTFFYNRLQNGIGTSGTFYLFSGCMAIYAAYVFFFLIETKGKSLEQINEEIKNPNKKKRSC